MGQVEIRGSVRTTGSTCCDSGASPNSIVQQLADGCPKFYDSVIATGQPLQVATAGAIGAAFQDLDLLDDLTAIELLVVQTTSDVILRIGADVARVLASGASYPTGFGGGETAILALDGGAQVTVTFDVADQTVDQVAARMNAALALAGYPTPRVNVVGGQLEVTGVLTGPQGSVEIVGGTGLATLGLTAAAAVPGAGADVPISGLFVAQFRRGDNAPDRVQVSGNARIWVVAGGTSS